MTTTTAVKINRAEVMKNAWQLFREKAVRTMKAWSEALRSAWKKAKAKGEEVVENAATAKQINYYRELILKEAQDNLHLFSTEPGSVQEIAIQAKSFIATIITCLDVTKTADKAKMSRFIDRAKQFDGIFKCVEALPKTHASNMDRISDSDALGFYETSIASGRATANGIWKAYQNFNQKAGVQNA